MPALLVNGLIVLQMTDPETSTLITRLMHVSGQWVESRYPLHFDQSPQQLGSELTYARRYCVSALLCLAAEDDDGQRAETGATPARAKASDGLPPGAMETAIARVREVTRRATATGKRTVRDHLRRPTHVSLVLGDARS